MQIYKTINIINNKIYIGKDQRSRKHYFGSGLYINSAIKKYGIENFKKEILEDGIDDKKLLCEREKFWIKELKSQNKNIGYNIATGGEGGDTLSNHPNKKEIFEKIKNEAIRRCNNKEFKEIISKRFLGRKKSKEQKLIQSIRQTGVKRPDITKALKGKKQPKTSKALKGKSYLELYSGNVNKANIRKNNISKSKLGKPSNYRKKIILLNTTNNQTFEILLKDLKAFIDDYNTQNNIGYHLRVCSQKLSSGEDKNFKIIKKWLLK